MLSPSLQEDVRRGARLLFAPELAAGALTEEDLERPEVERAVLPAPVPAPPVRAAQRLGMKLGGFSYERHVLAPLLAARRALLGAAAEGPPRFLVRVDEHPLAGAFAEDRRRQAQFARFHEILTDAGVPYLIAVNAGVARDYLDPTVSDSRPLSERELETLRQLRADGVAVALHGFDHRTRDARPRHHAELGGLADDELRELLDRATDRLEAAGVRPTVLVPPFNRFDARQYRVLAERYAVICGGPETVPRLGFHRTPLAREGAIYMPAYPPFYGIAELVAAAATRACAAGHAVWIPAVLHWSWESEDGFAGVRRLARVLAGRAWDWQGFLSAAERRSATPTPVLA